MPLTDTQQRAAFLRYQYGTREAARRVGVSETSLRRIANGQQSGESVRTQITCVEAGSRGALERERRLEGYETRATTKGRFYIGNPQIKDVNPNENRRQTWPNWEDFFNYIGRGKGPLFDNNGKLVSHAYIEQDENGDWTLYVGDTP